MLVTPYHGLQFVLSKTFRIGDYEYWIRFSHLKKKKTHTHTHTNLLATSATKEERASSESGRINHHNMFLT